MSVGKSLLAFDSHLRHLQLIITLHTEPGPLTPLSIFQRLVLASFFHFYFLEAKVSWYIN